MTVHTLQLKANNLAKKLETPPTLTSYTQRNADGGKGFFPRRRVHCQVIKQLLLRQHPQLVPPTITKQQCHQ